MMRAMGLAHSFSFEQASTAALVPFVVDAC